MHTPETTSPASSHPMDRRTAIKWMMTAAATTALLDQSLFGAATSAPASAKAVGYGTDPDVMKDYKPGDVWPLTFTDAQRATAAVLCDTIIPADGQGPGAAAVHVEAFVDEWISAPYPGHDADKKLVVEGLAWLNTEAQKRFGNDFVKITPAQRTAICDDICYLPNAKPEFRTAAQFFRRYRDLTSGGYYSTPAGMKDIGYTGNVALEKFEVPKEVLQKLGLA